MEAKVKGADLNSEIGRVLQEPGRLDENLALAKDFVNDVKTLAKSMSNLYEDQAARLISVGVTVEVNVNVMYKPAFHFCLGLSPSPKGCLVQADGREAETEDAQG